MCFGQQTIKLASVATGCRPYSSVQRTEDGKLVGAELGGSSWNWIAGVELSEVRISRIVRGLLSRGSPTWVMIELNIGSRFNGMPGQSGIIPLVVAILPWVLAFLPLVVAILP